MGINLDAGPVRFMAEGGFARCVAAERGFAYRVMAGLGPAIHDFSFNTPRKTWMAGPSPAMTRVTSVTSVTPVARRVRGTRGEESRA